MKYKDTTTTQHYAFFKAGPNTFYASSNSLYDAYPIANLKDFIVRWGWDYIAYKNGKCELLQTSGLVVPANCKFTKKGGKRWFNADWKLPGSTYVRKAGYLVVGKVFVHESMVSTSTFKRK